MKTLKWLDVVIPVGIVLAVSSWAHGEDRWMVLGFLVASLMLWGGRVVIQRRRYRFMTPTEQELYREQATWLQYRPRGKAGKK